MSVTDPSADPVQPDEGQGEPGTSDAPYAEYLNRIPEEVRGDVEPVFKDWDANVTRRFQEASEYRKSWEPFEQIGVNRLSPQDVEWALQFRQAAVENPASVWEWAQNYAREHGLTPQEAAQVAAEAQTIDEYTDPQQQLQQLLEQALNPIKQQVESVVQWRTQEEEARQLAAGQAVIDRQLAELRDKNPDRFTPEAQQWVEARAEAAYLSDPENALGRAWADYEALVNQIEKQVLQSKVDAPAPAERGGPPDVSPEKYSRIDAPGVKDAAVEFLRNSNRA